MGVRDRTKDSTRKAGVKMVRCKLRCNSVVAESGIRKVTLNPVYDSNPASPNFRWSDATPSGEITLTITNPSAFNQFTEGQHYFADFEQCAAEAVDKM
jgi:hypothetical protein